jgi:hypothetical protein
MEHHRRDGQSSAFVSWEPMGKGARRKFYCPITKLKQHLLAILYVDDTDILHINLTNDESVDEVHSAIQHSVNSWGSLLIATDGALQANKCFYFIISFEWMNGEWRYTNNTLRGEFGVTAPLPRGKAATIEHKSIDHAEKTLGAMTSPDGESAASIQMMQEKTQAWINAVRNGHLHHRNVWFLLKVQFWPRIGYRLCSLTALFHDLDYALHWQYYQMLPLCGVARSTPVGSRSMDAGFFGVGLPHLGVEALIAMSNNLLMHYGCDTATGRFMRISYSLFYLELGLSFQPMQESYQKYSTLVTHLWMKMLWEKNLMFDLHKVVADVPLQFPREGDQFLMQVLIKAGYRGDALRRLNRVQISLQVLFLSDVLTASGGKVSSDSLSLRPQGEAWSNMRWPNEHPTNSDMQFWNHAIISICPTRSSTSSVGKYIRNLHRVQR